MRERNYKKIMARTRFHAAYYHASGTSLADRMHTHTHTHTHTCSLGEHSRGAIRFNTGNACARPKVNISIAYNLIKYIHRKRDIRLGIYEILFRSVAFTLFLGQ